MSDLKDHRLLNADEPLAVETLNETGSSPYFFTCEHAGQLIPEQLGTLGLSEAHRNRHIAWDIGAKALAEGLAKRFNATCVLQTYSRLVVDCNRHTSSHDFIATISEATEIPGNQKVSRQQLAARSDEIYWPYQQTITQLLDERDLNGHPTIVIPVHTCTPTYHGQNRPWHIGVLYGEDRRFAEVLLNLLRKDQVLVVGDNQPYRIDPAKDYAIPVHGHRRGYLHAEFEVRQDLVSDTNSQTAWIGRLHALLEQALDDPDVSHWLSQNTSQD